jgi:hypothetical protein
MPLSPRAKAAQALAAIAEPILAPSSLNEIDPAIATDKMITRRGRWVVGASWLGGRGRAPQ